MPFGNSGESQKLFTNIASHPQLYYKIYATLYMNSFEVL